MTKEERLHTRLVKIGQLELYHYTSLGVLQKILEKNEFWWRSTSAMNDRLEIRYFTEGLRTAIREDITDLDDRRFHEFFDILDSRLSKDYPYAMCFSLLNDNAAQWERYAENGQGVCLVFNAEALLSVFDLPYIMHSKVYYDYDVRKHEHYDEAKTYIMEDMHKRFQSLTGEVDNLVACASFYKHDSFKTEEEFRTATLFPMTQKRLCELEATFSYELVHGVISKVLKVNFKRRCDKLNIGAETLFHSIVIGPRSLQNPDELREFCIDQGFPNLANRIRVSNCPLR